MKATFDNDQFRRQLKAITEPYDFRVTASHDPLYVGLPIMVLTLFVDGVSTPLQIHLHSDGAYTVEADIHVMYPEKQL